MRLLSEIAKDILDNWKTIPEYAKVYVDAMKKLDYIDDVYACESAADIVNYFLANASYWRGYKAQTIKSELKEMLNTLIQ